MEKDGKKVKERLEDAEEQVRRGDHLLQMAALQNTDDLELQKSKITVPRHLLFSCYFEYSFVSRMRRLSVHVRAAPPSPLNPCLAPLSPPSLSASFFLLYFF